MILSLINADILEYEKEMEEHDKFMRFYLEHPKLFHLEEKLRILWMKIMYNTFCQRGQNCDIDMDSECTPDYGREYWWCRRCGRGGTVHYY